jgi:5-formyltetrahydrofolate cyclo-ligase
MLKAIARKEYLQKRLNLSADEFQQYTERISEAFLSMSLPKINYLFSYYPLVKRKEFDVSLCEHEVRSRNPHVKIAWPKTDLDMSSMEACLLEEDGLFAKNRFDLLEPIGNDIIEPSLIDLTFVPLLAFDLHGYRVGYGKGFYDRYLTRCRQDMFKIGFCFFEPVEVFDDISEFDVPLNYCITPSRLYEF